MAGRAVVLATEETVANRLLRLNEPTHEWNRLIALLHFAQNGTPHCTSPILHLDGNGMAQLITLLS